MPGGFLVVRQAVSRRSRVRFPARRPVLAMVGCQIIVYDNLFFSRFRVRPPNLLEKILSKWRPGIEIWHAPIGPMMPVPPPEESDQPGKLRRGQEKLCVWVLGTLKPQQKETKQSRALHRPIVPPPPTV